MAAARCSAVHLRHGRIRKAPFSLQTRFVCCLLGPEPGVLIRRQAPPAGARAVIWPSRKMSPIGLVNMHCLT